MSEHEHWQLDGSAPELYERYLVTQRITFPSVFDYVRFQLIATPMAGLLANRTASEREMAIKDIASSTQLLIGADMLREGRLTFPQEAFVATASRMT